ncbi:hypothetical protein TD95_000664 [Thielaviopsis punctulata]|uniref:DASH complex subunit ASK1 n=1 Tax=Thielaviopsis punctulata TaxID=72032 RepID=A0A0F4ZHL7_9PEZI|nr:hypothetical protein TD95_000664 [Thielaviopsis punctulata]
MSRPSMPSRPLTMTEELEKIEQSITLTLQEIDSNFSKAHRIVTNSILPIVEQYGEHSKAVWEASMFWKQFFEASANVSLSGYDDNEEKNAEANRTMDETSALHDAADVSAVHSDGRAAAAADEEDEDATMTCDHDPAQPAKHAGGPEDSMLHDPDGELSGSTPRAPTTQIVKTQFADYESSPYAARTGGEASHLLSDEVNNHNDVPPSARRGAAIVDEDDTSLLFREKTARLPDYSYSFSPDKPAAGPARMSSPKKRGPMRSHVLKKTFKLPATPHRFVARMQSPVKATAATPASVRRSRAGAAQAPRKPWEDSPGSSPEMLVPHLRSEAFMSPMRTSTIRQKLEAVPVAGPRTPGVSIMTPRPGRVVARGGVGAAPGTQVGQDPFTVDKSGQTQAQTQGETSKNKYEIDWSSDSDDALGVSPPKTIQFALVPAKLVQTPAREASKRIVDDILATAGADKGPDHSPTMHKMNEDLLEDTF